jgi:hypothetical protein
MQVASFKNRGAICGDILHPYNESWMLDIEQESEIFYFYSELMYLVTQEKCIKKLTLCYKYFL